MNSSKETAEEVVQPKKQQEKIGKWFGHLKSLCHTIHSVFVLISHVFAVMFEDGKIGKSFCPSSAKILCNIFVGLAPDVKNLLQESKISFSLF